MFIFFHFVVTVRLLQKSNDGVRKPISVKKRFSEQPSRASVQSRKSVKSKAPSTTKKEEPLSDKPGTDEDVSDKTNDKNMIKADLNREESLNKGADSKTDET